jgi:hypothetical protein
MILHIVLYRPRPGLDAAARRGFIDAIAATRAAVPGITNFWVGRRLDDGPSYRMSGFPDFPFAAVVAFEDRAGLLAYLQHPLHDAVSQHFNSAAESAFIYDFEAADVSEIGSMLDSGWRA